MRLADLLIVLGSGSRPTTARNKINQKHADFVLCDHATLRPILVIELDDSSHGRGDREDRDKFVDMACGAAGLPILHVRAAGSYSSLQLESEIRAKLGKGGAAMASG